jgi:hypothetical protein
MARKIANLFLHVCIEHDLSLIVGSQIAEPTPSGKESLASERLMSISWRLNAYIHTGGLLASLGKGDGEGSRMK